MVIYGICTSMAVNAGPLLTIGASAGFIDSGGTAQNFSTQLNVTPPGVITAAAVNLLIQTAISDYANTNYGIHSIAADVVLLAGVVAI